MIESPAKVIEALGGYRAVAVRLATPPTTVASWLHRNSIPVKAWPDLIAFAKEQRRPGITYEALALAHARAA